MGEAARRLASYEDLLGLPEEVRAEVVGGQLVTLPSPLPRHGYVQAALGTWLGAPHGPGGGGGDDDGGGNGEEGWWILLDVDVRLGPHDIVRPDLAGWRRSRLSEPWDTRPIDVVPDWVAEVLSPSNERHDRGAKMALYGERGVEHLWLLDPAERTLEAYARRLLQERDGDEARWRWVLLGVHAEGERVRLPPFEQRDIELEALFPPKG